MAGKKKKKDKKASTGSLSHIASHLVPSAIFAAVPRTSTNLSSTWPRSNDRSQSPIAKALGEAGNVGSAFIGDSSRPSSRAADGVEDSPVSRSRTNSRDRPPALLPSEPSTSAALEVGGTGSQITSNLQFEEPGYESVDNKSVDFDKTTKYFNAKPQPVASGPEGSSRDPEDGNVPEPGQDHFYHILDHENNQVVEPPYSKVDKKKKSSSVAPAKTAQPDTEENHDDSDDSLGELSSSDDLTDVTSNDEESSVSSKPKSKRTLEFGAIKRSKKGSKKESKSKKVNKDEDTSEESIGKKKESFFHFGEAKKSKTKSIKDASSENSTDSISPHRKSKKSLKHKAQETIHELPVEEREDQLDESVESSVSSSIQTSPLYSEVAKSHKRGSKKSSLKRRAQVSPEGGSLDEVDAPREPLPQVPDDPSDPRFDENQKKAFKEIERLGFEGISQKVGLSDISEDDEGYTMPKVPQHSRDKRGRTQFERDQFNETISESFAIPENTEAVEASSFSPSEGALDSFALREQNPEEYRKSLESLEQIRHSQTESLERLEQIRQANENSFMEQQKHLERLIGQQETVYIQQTEQQRVQQRQGEELVQQQQKLQEQLRLLEKIQQERLVGTSNTSAAGTAGTVVMSDSDVMVQKEMLQQQEQILRMQQQQQRQYEQQQERVLLQQERLCEQIRQLEYQQKQLQSNISKLSPRDHELAEIRQQEQQIVNLLNEQKAHQHQYEQLHRLQQQRLEDQASQFQQERLALEREQQDLKVKIKEQEDRSRQLEKELEGVSNKAAKPRDYKRRRDSSESQDTLDDSPKTRERAVVPKHSDRVDAMPTKGKDISHQANPVYYLSESRLELLESEKSALADLNSSLQEENRALKQLAVSLQKGAGGSSIVLQQQIKDLQQQNKILRETVHRLNVELSRFQSKYRPVLFEEVEGLALPSSIESAPWLVNTRYLAPLFLAYDDRLKEKEDTIKIYDEDLTSFKARVMEVVKENQELHMRLNKAKPDALDLDEWQQLQEQAKLVVEENALLMEQQDIQQRKMKEMQRLHGQDVSKLSRRIAKLESEKRRLETETEDLNRNHGNLIRKYEGLVAENEKRISLEEHLAVMDECRSVLEDMKEKKKTEAVEMTLQNQAIQNEKQNLAANFADANARVSQLERELEAYRKSQRKSERKALFLERKLEHIQEREITAQETLSEVLKVAERTADERDSYEQFAKSQKCEQKKAASIIRRGDQSIVGLQEKLKESKKKSSRKMANVTGRLQEKDKEINKQKDHYETEVNNLRALLRDKQKQLESMLGERRIFDQELDMVWKKAAEDNKYMKDAVQERNRSHELSPENS